LGATEEALSAGDFATALLIASRCDEATYIAVARKYAENSFYKGSPMYTAALLFSGALQSPDGTASGNWGIEPKELKQTWKGHLAAIISNRTPGCEGIVLSLGDRLLEIGDVTGAHFCYMVCGCAVEAPTNENARLVLLGCDHRNSSNTVLSTTESLEAFQRTEAFEWAKRQGNKNAMLVSFQPFKLIYAMLLVDGGMRHLAQLFVESIRAPSSDGAAFVAHSTDSEIQLSELFSDTTAFRMAVSELKAQVGSETGPSYRYSETILMGGTLRVEMEAAGRTMEDPLEGENAAAPIASHKTSDPDSSYLSAKSNLMDVTGYSLDSPELHSRIPMKKSERTSLPPLQEGPIKTPEVSPIGSATPMHPNKANSQVLQAPSQGTVVQHPEILADDDQKPSTRVPPLDTSEPTTVLSTPSVRQKPASPPKTAPARIGSKTDGNSKTPTTPAPSSGSSFGSLTRWIAKIRNPDATVCFLPETEEKAYFDEQRKRKLFYPTNCS
jgi:Sec23-binding domain of Sec16